MCDFYKIYLDYQKYTKIYFNGERKQIKTNDKKQIEASQRWQSSRSSDIKINHACTPSAVEYKRPELGHHGVRQISYVMIRHSADYARWNIPDGKVHGANMGPTWGRKDPDWPHVGHTKIAIWIFLYFIHHLVFTFLKFVYHLVVIYLYIIFLFGFLLLNITVTLSSNAQIAITEIIIVVPTLYHCWHCRLSMMTKLASWQLPIFSDIKLYGNIVERYKLSTSLASGLSVKAQSTPCFLLDCHTVTARWL